MYSSNGLILSDDLKLSSFTAALIMGLVCWVCVSLGMDSIWVLETMIPVMGGPMTMNITVITT